MKLRAPNTRLFLLLLTALSPCLVGPYRVAAQVDIEALRPGDLPPGPSGSLGGDLTVRTGNVDFVQVGVRGRHQHAAPGVVTLLVGDGGIGFLGSSRYASSGLLHFRRTHRPDAAFSPEWFAQANYDRAQLLVFRGLVGAGARARLAAGEWGQVGAGGAVMLEHERLELPDTSVHAHRTNVARGSAFLSVRVSPAEQLVVTSTTYVQPDLGDLGDLRLLENFRLATPITEQLSLTVSFDLRYDAGPPDGIASLDTTLRTGVSFSY